MTATTNNNILITSKNHIYHRSSIQVKSRSMVTILTVVCNELTPADLILFSRNYKVGGHLTTVIFQKVYPKRYIS